MNSLMARRRALMGASGGRIPAEYKEVEYIESFGKQAINTELYPTDNFELVVIMARTDIIKTDGLCGCRSGDTWGAYVYITPTGSPTYCKVATAYGDQNIYVGGNVSNTNYHTLSIKLDSTGLVSTLDGTIYSKQPYRSIAIQEKYTLFACNVDGVIDTTRSAKIKAKNFKIYVNGILIRNYISCYRKSDSKPGMYDLCGSDCPLTNSPFYINAGTGEFTVGPNV